MGALSDVKAADKFASSYAPAEGDHGDLESRVVMYRRAVKSGDKRKIAIHARTLMRFVSNTRGADEATRSTSSSSSSSSGDGPSKADLKAQAKALGLPVSGSIKDLEKRIGDKLAADKAEADSEADDENAGDGAS